MRLVFIGATEFSRRCLAACLDLDAVQVVGVVTSSPRFEISYRPSGVQNVRHADLAELAQSASIPVLNIARGMGDASLLESVVKLRPDAFVVAGWFHMIPRSWREFAPAYGLHASLLPAYRGGAPLVWAMINGEKETGITMFMLDDGVDTGPIVGQRSVPIHPDDTIATLYSRIESAGLELVRAHLPRIAAGTAALTPQRPSNSGPCPQRGPEDGIIDWSQTAEAIDRFVRAQTRPYPGAFTFVDGRKIHIWRAAVLHEGQQGITSGLVWREVDGYVVGCGNGALRLLEVSRGDECPQAQTSMSDVFGSGGQLLSSEIAAEHVTSESHVGTDRSAPEKRPHPSTGGMVFDR